MFAQLFGTPETPASAQPAAPDRADEWSHLIDSIVDGVLGESEYGDEPWDLLETAATLRFLNSAGEWESCDAAIEHRDDYRAVVSAPYSLEQGDTVWVEDEELARLYVVQRSTLIHDGSRLELRMAHVERRRMSRREEESMGHLELLTGDEDRVRTVTVNNVSGGGAQIESREPLADWAPVRLRFRDRDRTGAVRYCREYQGTYVAGIQFTFDPSELS